MNQEDKRRSGRKDVQTRIAMMMAAGSLEGETVNLSQEGVLLQAEGHISVYLKIEGTEYRGKLVRVTPINSGTLSYAIELDAPMEEDPAEAPGPQGL